MTYYCVKENSLLDKCAIINVTYRCHIISGMILVEREKDEDRQADRHIIRRLILSGGSPSSGQSKGAVI